MIIELADATFAIAMLLGLVVALSYATVFALQLGGVAMLRLRERAVVWEAGRVLRRRGLPVSEARRRPPSGGA